MTNREQAVKQVADAIGETPDDIIFGMRPHRASSKLTRYAVDTTERVLELEAFLEKVISVNVASMEPDVGELSDALGGIAYEAMRLQARLQPKGE